MIFSVDESVQERYDEAMFLYSQGDYRVAIEIFESILDASPDNFEVRLSLGMAYCREGDFERAIKEGHLAEQLKPNEQLVHTNLSLFYMRSGDKEKAEHHGLQARIASWKQDMSPPGEASSVDPELSFSQDKPKAYRTPEKFPEMPWKKKDESS